MMALSSNFKWDRVNLGSLDRTVIFLWGQLGSLKTQVYCLGSCLPFLKGLSGIYPLRPSLQLSLTAACLMWERVNWGSLLFRYSDLSLRAIGVAKLEEPGVLVLENVSKSLTATCLSLQPAACLQSVTAACLSLQRVCHCSVFLTAACLSLQRVCHCSAYLTAACLSHQGVSPGAECLSL